MAQLENDALTDWGVGLVDDAKKALREIEGLKTDIALAGCSSVPVVGIACDIASFGRSVYNLDFAGAALDAVGVFPVIGDGIKGTAAGAKLAKVGAKIADAGGLKKAVASARAGINQAQSLVRAGGKGLRSAAKNAGILRRTRQALAHDYWRAVSKKRAAIVKNFKRCSTQECATEMHKLNRKLGKITNLPDPAKGKWVNRSGKAMPAGNGIYVPDAKLNPEMHNAIQAHAKHQGADFSGGIPYVNGQPDLSAFPPLDAKGNPIMATAMNGRKIPHVVEIDLARIDDYSSANAARKADRRASNRAFKAITGQDVPNNATWHHTGDGATMMLVDPGIHHGAGGAVHTGGHSMINSPTF